jgi:hypothetical protein
MRTNQSIWASTKLATYAAAATAANIAELVNDIVVVGRGEVAHMGSINSLDNSAELLERELEILSSMHATLESVDAKASPKLRAVIERRIAAFEAKLGL